MKTTKKNLAVFAVCALACSLAPVKAEAASAVKLSEKSATLLIQAKNGKIIYGTTKIKVKKAKKIKVKKVTYKSQNKKIASVSQKGSVKAVGKGTTKISVTVKYKMGKKTITKKLIYKVEVINLLGNIQGGDDQNTSNDQSGSSDKNTGNDKTDTSDKDISSKEDEIPETAIELDGHYYQLYDEGYNWQEAKNKCEDLGGHLVTITSLDEQKLIEKLLEDGSRNSYWIGGYKKDGDWKWITDEEFSFSNWSSGEPDNITYTSPTGEDSLMIYRNSNPLAPSSLGGWNDLYNDGTCGKEKFFGLSNFGFICEWESGSAISSKEDEIPETAIELDGHYYQLYDEGYNWQEAKNKCEDLGGHLVTITSLDEQKLIEKLLEDGSRNSYWIGGYKKDGDWKWITDEEFSFSNWSFGEPNNITYTSPTGEDSLMVYRNLNPLAPSSLGGWNDLYNDGTCGKEKFFGLSNLGFICEWESGSANNQ